MTHALNRKDIEKIKIKKTKMYVCHRRGRCGPASGGQRDVLVLALPLVLALAPALARVRALVHLARVRCAPVLARARAHALSRVRVQAHERARVPGVHSHHEVFPPLSPKILDPSPLIPPTLKHTKELL